MPKRLPNNELAYYENVLALLYECSTASKRLMYDIDDDPELLSQVNQILRPLASIKRLTLQRREERKGE